MYPINASIVIFSKLYWKTVYIRSNLPTVLGTGLNYSCCSIHISRQKEMLLYMDIDYLLYIGQLTKGS